MKNSHCHRFKVKTFAAAALLAAFGMQNSTHMYTYITALFVCDSCDEDARKALKRCKLYKSFKLSYWGWMDFHTGLVVLPEENQNLLPDL